MKVKIKVAPAQREIDGINLEQYKPGSVREVSSSVGSWLIAEGFAEPEMRATPTEDEQFYSASSRAVSVVNDRRKRDR